MDERILGVAELAGDRVVGLRVDELHVVGLITCTLQPSLESRRLFVMESKLSECMET